MDKEELRGPGHFHLEWQLAGVLYRYVMPRRKVAERMTLTPKFKKSVRTTAVKTTSRLTLRDASFKPVDFTLCTVATTLEEYGKKCFKPFSQKVIRQPRMTVRGLDRHAPRVPCSDSANPVGPGLYRPAGVMSGVRSDIT